MSHTKLNSHTIMFDKSMNAEKHFVVRKVDGGDRCVQWDDLI